MILNRPTHRLLLIKRLIVSSVESILYLFQGVSSHLDVPATLPEALSQHGDHIFMVVQQLLHQFTETGLNVLILDLDIEGGTSA